eukprot:557790-Prorocentrum_minimum.AAC.5
MGSFFNNASVTIASAAVTHTSKQPTDAKELRLSGGVNLALLCRPSRRAISALLASLALLPEDILISGRGTGVSGPHRDFDARGRIKNDGMGEPQAHLKLGSLHGRPVTNTDELEVLSPAIRHALHHVERQCSAETVECLGLARLVLLLKPERAVLLNNLNLGVKGVRQLSELTLKCDKRPSGSASSL